MVEMVPRSAVRAMRVDGYELVPTRNLHTLAAAGAIVLGSVCFATSFATHEAGSFGFYIANQTLTFLLWVLSGRARSRRWLMVWPIWVTAGLLSAAFAAPASAALCVGAIVIAFLFVGLTQPRWSSFLLLPFAAATYLVAIRALPVGQAAPRAVLALLTWISVAEFPAWLAARLREARREVAVLALTDPLTGLRNRRAWEQQLAQIGDSGMTSVLLIDLDHFKRYNDEHGHLGGDVLLVEFARGLQKHATGHATVARWGGEEFAICLPSTSSADALVVARQVLASVPRSQSCSIGVATSLPAEEPDSLMQRADRALYQAKGEGRSRVVTA